MNIMVTGGAGFIGSHVAKTLEEYGHKVVVIDNFVTGRTENLKGFRGSIEICDVADNQLLQRKFSIYKPDIIHHLAAQSAISVSEKNPAQDARVNIVGTLNLLAMSKRYNVRRFVFSSTSAVYGRKRWGRLKEHSTLMPDSPYGISKLAAEWYIRQSDVPHCIFRYANVYGPKQVSIGENQVIARSLSHFFNGTDFKIVGDGRQERDFVFVEDVAYAHLLATVDDLDGTMNLATGKSHSVNEVVDEIADLCDVRGYKWEHTNSHDPRGSVYMDNWAIRTCTGMKFTPLRDGLKKTIDWWQKKGE